MDITLLNKLLDDKENRKLLLESTLKQLDYIRNYKSEEERCFSHCDNNCNDCEEEDEEELEFKFNTIMERLLEICNNNDLRLIQYEEYNNDSGKTYTIELKEI